MYFRLSGIHREIGESGIERGRRITRVVRIERRVVGRIGRRRGGK